MKSTVQSTAARGTFLQICFLLNRSKPVSVHLQMNIETFSFVFPIFNSSRDCEEAIADGGMLMNEVGSFMAVRIVIVLQRHGDSVTSNGFLFQFGCVQDFNSFFVGINSRIKKMNTFSMKCLPNSPHLKFWQRQVEIRIFIIISLGALLCLCR